MPPLHDYLSNQFRFTRPTAVWCLAILCFGGLSYGSPPVNSEILDQRRTAIAEMSAPQRQELVRKYQQFQHLDDAERQKLQTLHDAMTAEPDLKQVMNDYCEWLKHLDLVQREELRQAKTPEQKRNLVVRYYQAQLKSKEAVWRELTPPLTENRILPVLSSDELKSVMKVLEKELVEKNILDKKSQLELAGLEGTLHYKYLIHALGDYRKPVGGMPRDFELSKPVFDALRQVVQQGDERKRLAEPWRNPENRQRAERFVFILLARSTAEEVRREFSRRGAEQLKESLFNAWPPDRQARFSQAVPSQRDPMLMRSHLEEIWQAFSLAGDIPIPHRLPGDGNPRGRGADSPQPLRNGEGPRPLRPGFNRAPDSQSEDRRRKTE